MDLFIDWWFGRHWFWSTILTPEIVFAWACWKGLAMRAIAAFIMLGGSTVHKHYHGDRP